MSEDPDRPLDPTLATQDWAEVLAVLLEYAKGRTHKNVQLAYDMAVEAIRRTLDPAQSRYDAAIHGDLHEYLGSVVNGLLSNHWRSASRRREVGGVEPVVVEHLHAHAVTPEAELDAREEAAFEAEETALMERVLEQVRKKLLESDPPALELLELAWSGVDKPAEQAAITGRPVKEILNIRKRRDRALAEALEAERDRVKKGGTS